MIGTFPIGSKTFGAASAAARARRIPAFKRSRARSVWLVEIRLLNSGPTLYLSDRNVTVQGQRYEYYLDDLSGLGEELRRADSGGLNADIALVFDNGRYQGYNRLVEIGETYPFDGAGVTIKAAYLDDDGTLLDLETVYKGVIEGPTGITPLAFECRVSSLEFFSDRAWKQAAINNTDFPNAWEDLGMYEPIIYGSDVLVPALRVDWGARTTLKSDISDSDTTIELSDASRLPASGSVWIDDEKVSYTGKSGNSLTGCTRGVSDSAASHSRGAEVVEHKDQYDSLLAGHELHTVGDIYAEIEGALLRVTAGVSAVLSGGKHLLRATSLITLDETDIENIFASTEKTVDRSSTNLPVQLSYFNSGGFKAMTLNFPAAPSGTLSDIRTSISYSITVLENPSAQIDFYLGPGTSYKKIATVKADGTVENHIGNSFEISESSWQTR
jgi:hypothetical protein